MTTSTPNPDLSRLCQAWAVVVGADGPTLAGVEHVTTNSDALDVSALACAIRPEQIWVVVGVHPSLEATVEAAGAVFVSCGTDDVITHLAHHAVARHRAVDERMVEAMLEITTLRRELNHAVSALSSAHPVLGLMPSMTIEQFNAERSPTVPLKPHDGDALMSHRRSIPLSDEDAAQLLNEVEQLRSELEAIRATRLMRWAAGPRRVYGSVLRRT